MKKLLFAFVIFLGAVVLFFVGFSVIKCEKSTPKNFVSQLHMLVAPAQKQENPQWDKLKSILKDRCGSLAEFRIFQSHDEGYAVFEVSGAKDPNMIASMLLMKGDTQILTTAGDKIASGDDILMAGIMMSQSNSSQATFGIQISDTAVQRLEYFIKKLKPGQSVKVDLFVDSVKTIRAEILPNSQNNMIVFKTPEKMDMILLDYLGQAITYRLPYELAVDRSNSYLIPPQTDKAALIDFQDILGKISLATEQK